jgi:phosphoglycerate dehydrogenase-like enzyme
MSQISLLVLGDPTSSHLKLLSRLPDETNIAVTVDKDKAREHIADADAILCDMGRVGVLKDILPEARKLRWIHSISAGVESFLFPEMLASPIPLTNGRGAYKRSLAEFVIYGCMFFAKDTRRMLRQHAEGRWEQYYMEEIHGRTLGIVGYGEIGRASAAAAAAFGMKVLAMRRRPELSAGDPNISGVYGNQDLRQMLAECDYICVAAPNSKDAIGLIGAEEFAVMKPNAVIINVGRGPVIVESELVKALQERRIRGAALDVFDIEPLPDGHPFYALDNVLISPHCADRVTGWLEIAMEIFIDNFDRFSEGRPLNNIVDKQAGY